MADCSPDCVYQLFVQFDLAKPFYYKNECFIFDNPGNALFLNLITYFSSVKISINFYSERKESIL